MRLDEALHQGALLDARYHALRGKVERTKELTLAELARVLTNAGTPYAIIGGVAMQAWRLEPRTTLDVELAVLSYGDVPREALLAAGFSGGDRHAHSENWVGPDGTPVQFTDDQELRDAVLTAISRPLGAAALRIAAPITLVRSKLRAAADPARRRSKRLSDLSDALGLVEDHPELEAELSEQERQTLQGGKLG